MMYHDVKNTNEGEAETLKTDNIQYNSPGVAR